MRLSLVAHDGRWRITGLVGGYAVLTRQIEDAQHKDALAIAELGYAVNKLQFCYAHGISPCNDTTLTDWNSKNSQNQFQITTEQQRVEDVILLEKAN